jgi:hypothetical protein
MKIRYIFYVLAFLIALASKMTMNAGFTEPAFILMGIAFAVMGGSYALARYCDRRFGHEN